MDSFELNKVAGAVLGVLTFTLGLNVFTDIAWTPHAPEKPGFIIEVPETDASGATAAPAPEVPIANLLGAASVEKGEAQAKKCAACHNFVEGAGAKVGPDLYGVVGREVASAPGFAYSAAMKAHGGTWTFEELNAFLKNPKADIPGTSMGFAGLAKEGDRADLLVYLNTLSHSPQPLPEPVAEPAAAPASEASDVPPPQGADVPSGDTPGQAPAPAEGAAPAAGNAPTGDQPAPTAPASGAANPGEGAAPTQDPAQAQPAPTQPAPGEPGSSDESNDALQTPANPSQAAPAGEAPAEAPANPAPAGEAPANPAPADAAPATEPAPANPAQ